MNTSQIIHSLNMRQILALRLLRKMRSATPTQLAKAMHASSAAATGLRDRFEKLGLTTSAHDTADRRNINVQLTPLGHTVCAAMETMLAVTAEAA